MISDGKQRLGESDAATSLLDEAVSWTDTIPQFAARSSALIDISSRCAARGFADRVRKLGITNLRNIAEIRDESSQSSAVASLSEVYSKAGIAVGDEEKPLILTCWRNSKIIRDEVVKPIASAVNSASPLIPIRMTAGRNRALYCDAWAR